MENNPITDNDFGPEEDDRIWKCRIQSAKRLLKQKQHYILTEIVQWAFDNISVKKYEKLEPYIKALENEPDACFQIDDGDDKE